MNTVCQKNDNYMYKAKLMEKKNENIYRKCAFYDVHIDSMLLEKANELQFCLCHNYFN